MWSTNNQMNFRINSEHKMHKFLTIGENLYFNRKQADGFQEWEFRHEYNTPLIDILQANPFNGDYDENGNWVIHDNEMMNPRVTTDNMDRQRNYNSINGNLFAKLYLYKDLVFTSKINGSLNFNNEDDFRKEFHYTPFIMNEESSYEKRSEQSYGWEFQNYFNYDFAISQSHNFDITLGIESKYFYTNDIRGIRYDLINNTEEMQYFDASLNDSEKDLTGSGIESSSWALFGRLNYNLPIQGI